jgi:hypothetical protein
MRLPLLVFSLSLDSMPWIAATYVELMRLRDVQWKWVIVEGVSKPVADTRWIANQAPRVSQDGTSEFLDAIAHHPRIQILRRKEWPGKTAMCQAATDLFTEPGVCLQADSDEVHSTDQLRRIVELFEDDPSLMNARFECDYLLGPNVRTTDKGNPNEWRRAWRFSPGMKWISHEPPNLAGNHGKSMTREETAALGLTFFHASWLLPKHVSQKEAIYGPKYAGALAGWHKLQANTEWPLRDAGRFLPKAFAGTPCDKIF